MPKKDPGYDYENKGDRQVCLRFEHVYGHYYVLQFTTTSTDDDLTFLPRIWHDVLEYVPTTYGDIKPGENCETNVNGNWIKHTFRIDDADAGLKMLDELRKHIHTVRDIYRHFIEDGISQRKLDLERYNKYQEQLKRLPDIIG